jgi:cell wall-associated NlpC family hydrolase
MKFKILYSVIFMVVLSGCSMLGGGPAPVSSPEPEAPAVRPAPSPPPADAQLRRSEALLQALLALGIDYRYGGQSPTSGFDCSGLVAHVFQQAYALRLPRNTYGQSQVGAEIAQGDLEAGDLVFFNTLNRPYSHVGIYLGDGRFVHAPRTGARVRVERLDAAYWAKRFNGGRRVAT